MIARNVRSQLPCAFVTVSIACLFFLTGAPAWGDTYTFTSDTTIDPNDTTYDGHDIIVDGCALTVDGAHAFNSLEIINAGNVTHSANTDEQVYMLDLTIATHVTVNAGSRIDVSGRGYASEQGPGAGANHVGYGSGAGHGGEGGRATTRRWHAKAVPKGVSRDAG